MSSRSLARAIASAGAVDALSAVGMKLTVREAARLLSVSESELYRWVEEGEIPFLYVNHQPLFHREELLEWATSRRMPLSIELFADEGHPVLLGDALVRGGIHRDVGGSDVASTLRAVVERMPIEDDAERETIADIMIAREADASTAVGNGIAIPHVRSPVVFAGQPAAVTLCFLDHAVQFDSIDGKPVTTVFAMMTPTVRGHLQLLSRLSLALHDPGFVAVLLRRAEPDAILAEARRVDDTLLIAPPSETTA
jgi:PTS system nitrogen regulatory IIA component